MHKGTKVWPLLSTTPALSLIRLIQIPRFIRGPGRCQFGPCRAVPDRLTNP